MNGFHRVNEFMATPELPELGPGPRAGVLPKTSISQAIDRSLGDAPLAAGAKELLRALVLLWHDHLDAAHVIAQNLETPDGSFVHGIMHRREPDYGNAKYWFRRVGGHACFPEIGRRAVALLDAKSSRDLQVKLLPRGQWDAFAFVDACEEAARKPASDPNVVLLREIQRIEFEVLAEHLCR